MRKETISKIILVLIMGVILFARPINVLATGAADINSYWDDWEDQGSKGELQGTTEDKEETPAPAPAPAPAPTPTTPEPTKPTTTTPQKEQELPKAGLAEDTLMVVSIIALIGMATIAYKKVNEYNNI